MQDFMRRWTGAIVVALGVGMLILSLVAFISKTGVGVWMLMSVILGSLGIIFAGLAIDGISKGMNQIGDVLTQIMKGLQARD